MFVDCWLLSVCCLLYDDVNCCSVLVVARCALVVVCCSLLVTVVRCSMLLVGMCFCVVRVAVCLPLCVARCVFFVCRLLLCVDCV